MKKQLIVTLVLVFGSLVACSSDSGSDANNNNTPDAGLDSPSDSASDLANDLSAPPDMQTDASDSGGVSDAGETDTGPDATIDMADMSADMGTLPMDLQQLHERFLSNLCDGVHECHWRDDRKQSEYHLESLTYHMMSYPDAAACKAAIPQILVEFAAFRRLTTAVLTGRRGIDPAEAERSVEEAYNAICRGAEIDFYDRDAFPEQTQVGESCVTRDDCVGGFCGDEHYLICGAVCESAVTCGNTTCSPEQRCNAGVCENALMPGDACTSTTQCKRFLGHFCNSGFCAERYKAAQGEACDFQNLQSRGLTCQQNLRCDEQTNTCLARLAIGSACTATGSCEYPSYCEAAASVCVEFVSVAQGGQCYGRDAYCQAGLECAQDGTCQPYSGPAANQACDVFNSAFCPPGQYCSFDTSICVPQPTAGEACEGEYCANGLACVNSVCTPAKTDGAACDGRFQCQGYCDPNALTCMGISSCSP